MKRFGIPIQVLAVVILAAGCREVPMTPADQWSSTTMEGVDLSWRVSGRDLDVEVSAATTGWVAVGFDSGFHMENANIIIGYVSSGTARIRDDFGTAEFVHQPDITLGGDQNVSNRSGTENGGVTTLRFTIPLDSGDLWDKKLEKGRSYQVVVMYGEDGADNFTSCCSAIANCSITI